MFVRNTDTGKWIVQTDSLSKDNYDDLKQDLEKTRLYSKCLSGSTYLSINSFENIYDTFDIDKIGFYINATYPPLNGPRILIDGSNSNEFFNKYLKENAFSIKNLFTPNKLISDQYKNQLLVDVATVFPIDDLGQVNNNYVIDGVRLVNGHRVLVKNQTSNISLSTSVDPEVYFSTTELVSEYFVDTDEVTSINYFWFNNENGIYEYIDNRLVKTTDLDSYEDAYKYSVVVKLGVENIEKQFHLARLRNGYYPLNSENQNCQFIERKNWVLRNRVDYNNIFDINYYDILAHSTQSVYYPIEGITYSIPPRTVYVGEFGVIINNQDKITATSSNNQSHIISNKFKTNLRSIVELVGYYWVCGDEGTLLKIRKSDFNIERIDLGETSNLKSISFFGELYGKVVGEFNTIWWTKDGGLKWNKTEIPELDGYSYNKVVYYDLNRTYVGGDAGVFLEFTFINGEWVSYRRKVAKQLNVLDEYILIEDVNDLFKTDWVRLEPLTFIKDSSSIDFGQSLILNNFETNDFSGITPTYSLTIQLDSQYFGLSTFSSSSFFGAIKMEDLDGNIIYQNPNFGTSFSPTSSYDFYLSNLYSPSFINQVTLDLTKELNQNLKNTSFLVSIEFYYNYDALTNTIGVYILTNYDYQVDTKSGEMLLLSCNNETIICYDIDSLITKSNNQFIYFTPTQSFSDVRGVTRESLGYNIYATGDKIYKFNFGAFLNSGTISNASTGYSEVYLDKFVNKLYLESENDYQFIVGNNSLAQFLGTFSNFSDLDPEFDSRLQSRLLFLDYDVASKLNFFTDDGEYRLPISVTFSQTSFTQSFSLTNISGQTNWLNYYKDAEKTFKYYSSITDSNRVEFSTTFSNVVGRTALFTLNSSQVSTSLSEILPLAPSINSATFSKFIQQSTPIANVYSTNFNLLLNRYLLIFKLNLTKSAIDSGLEPQVGEVLRLESNVIDCNLVINRIEAYGYTASIPTSPRVRLSLPTTLTTGQRADYYCYCYSNFNQNIIKNLQTTTSPITITNLNKYNDFSDLIEIFELHPVSIGYKMESNDNDVIISPRFNNKTAYYNLAATSTLGSISKDLDYLDSFLDFGYTPTYNILDYLEKVNSRFNPSYKLSIMPEFYGLAGNNGGGFTDSNIFIDLTIGAPSPTDNYYRTGTNQMIFGVNLKFNWDAILLHTFVDVSLFGEVSSSPGTYQTYNTTKLLVTKKYFNSELNGYVIEFNKKFEVDNSVANVFNIISIDIVSRNTLGQISQDLQVLNNIQRSSTTRSVEILQTFTNLENEIFSKFPTDSYFKVFASDYNIREFISAIIYTDSEYEIAMNLFNVEEEKKYEILYTTPTTLPIFGSKLKLILSGQHELKVGDLVKLEFTGGTGSSQELNPQYLGLHSILESVSSGGYSYITMQIDYGLPFGTSLDPGTVTFIKKDPFFNYIPIDLFDLGSDKKVNRAIEVKPENYVLSLNKYNLENIDLTNYRYRLIDGLSLEELNRNYGWILEAEISDAIIGRDKDGGLIWYSGNWHCGRWFSGTWYSGRWISGDWYSGNWNSYNTTPQIISVIVDDSYNDNSASRWYNGRWFDGTWNGGTWYNGRRYSGEWKTGIWYDGIWNDGTWLDGRFEGGVWVLGTWESGVFNCDSKPAYFLDGVFKSGDFENGIWYNGQFGNERGRLARFGTKSSNSRTSLWHAGRWIDGEFHSFLNLNSSTGLPDVSEIHKYSIWRTGVWLKGNFYGGIAYNIDFKGGTWHGGILEEIQVIGVDPILPASTSTNSITVNGIFKFNPGDSIWMIDDFRGGAFSPLGNNDLPRKYRINQILELDDIKQTKLFLNFNLSTLGVNSTIATQSYSNVETGLRVVSYFKDAYWKSGLWTNGIFDGGQFDSGIWYNGVFDGTWGN